MRAAPSSPALWWVVRQSMRFLATLALTAIVLTVGAATQPAHVGAGTQPAHATRNAAVPTRDTAVALRDAATSATGSTPAAGGPALTVEGPESTATGRTGTRLATPLAGRLAGPPLGERAPPRR